MASTAAIDKMTDEQFEQQAFAVIVREFGLGGLARFIRLHRSGPGTTPPSATIGKPASPSPTSSANSTSPDASQLGKIIRIDTKSIRAAGRSTTGVKLLDLEDQDKVAAAVVIPPEEAKTQPEEGTLLQ
jgi:DNA gyrase/topoisomerase IV subunit A